MRGTHASLALGFVAFFHWAACGSIRLLQLCGLSLHIVPWSRMAQARNMHLSLIESFKSRELHFCTVLFIRHCHFINFSLISPLLSCVQQCLFSAFFFFPIFSKTQEKDHRIVTRISHSTPHVYEYLEVLSLVYQLENKIKFCDNNCYSDDTRNARRERDHSSQLLSATKARRLAPLSVAPSKALSSSTEERHERRKTTDVATADLRDQTVSKPWIFEFV